MDGLGSIGSSYLEQAADSLRNNTSKALAASTKKYDNSTDEELMEACKQFEAYFVEQVLKEAEKTIPESSILKDNSTSTLVDFFKDSARQEIAENIQKQNGIGLAQQMYEQMKRTTVNISDLQAAAMAAAADEDEEAAVAEADEETSEEITTVEL